ncbi:MAG: acyl-CoA/acyl-ACP dehydrogenase [Roseovarius sp.]|nr:acyl-CoA/acyl-ACP dehydrogenase [Roseovarius sp.]
MDYRMTDDQRAIRAAIMELCQKFPPSYWRERDARGGFPEDFYRAVAEGGWLGIAMPQEFGGSGLGITEAAVMMQAIGECGGGLSACSAIHMNIFGLSPVVAFGTQEQKRRMLTPLIRGETKACFAVTEPTTGLNTTKLKTRAVRKGDTYYISGQKVWISTAQVADHMLIIARTTPEEECRNPTDGLSLFYTRLDRDHVQIREIDKMGRKAIDSNELFIENLPVPAADLIGEEGKGFRHILFGMNAERVLVSAECVGIGRYAVQRAAAYANERVVFDRPIGQNQGIQHPLARAWMQLEAANHMMFQAATQYDRKEPCGIEANSAKLLASEAAFFACERAILTHGGFGYAKEFDVERLLREVMILRIAPVSTELILSNVAEKQLGLPRSY